MVSQTSTQRHHVEDDDAESDNDALPNLQTVDPGQDVDGVGAEDGQETHVDIVE